MRVLQVSVLMDSEPFHHRGTVIARDIEVKGTYNPVSDSALI
jgi:hypothetical protein